MKTQLRALREDTYQIPRNKLVVRDKQAIRLLSKDTILYCQSDSNYAYIFLSNGERILLSKCLKDLALSLPEPNFIRIHASYLINLDYLERINYSPSKTVLLKNEIALPVSRSRFSVLINLFTSNPKPQAHV